MASDLLLRSEGRRAVDSGRIRDVRSAARISQRELACEIGVTVGAVSRWEAGERVPRGEIAARLGRVLRELERAVELPQSEPDGVAAVGSVVCADEAASEAASSQTTDLSSEHTPTRGRDRDDDSVDP